MKTAPDHEAMRLRPQPRVAASATLATSKKRNFNRNAVASFSQREMHNADATALRLRTFSSASIRGQIIHFNYYGQMEFSNAASR